MSLSLTLELVAACLTEVEAGTIELTPKGLAAMGTALRSSIREVQDLERAVTILRASQSRSPDVAAVQLAVAAGTVALLPTHRTMAVLGYGGLDRAESEGTP